MDWRVFTLINSLIALVTLIAVIFDFNAHRRMATATELQSGSTRAATGSRRHAGHQSVNSVTDLRVDKLDSVPPSEFYDLFLNATPEEMNAVAQKFNELPGNVRTAGGIGMFFQAWAELDAKSALVGASSLTDVSLRRMATDAIVHSVSPGVAPALAAYLRDHPDRDLLNDYQNRFMDALLERWSGFDPAGAATFLDNLKEGGPAASAAKIAFAWGNLDPTAALAWIQKPNRTEQSDGLFVEIIKGWSRSDLAAAGAYLAQHADHGGAQTAAASVVGSLMTNDPTQAINWISTLPRSDARLQAETRLAHLWGERDPAAAAHWIEALPKEDQVSVIPYLAGAWSAQDWPATRRWIGTLANDARDHAISAALGSSFHDVTRAEALPLAMSITNRAERLSTIEPIIREWVGSDAPAAEAWIRRSNLRQNEKEELLAILSEQPERERIITTGTP